MISLQTIRKGLIFVSTAAFSLMPVAGSGEVTVLVPSDEKNKTISYIGNPKGTPEIITEDAVKAIKNGLKYLRNTQKNDGSWSEKNGSRANAFTSLAIMAFLIEGIPDNEADLKTLQKGRAFLLKQAEKDSNGYIGASMYEHGLATLALSRIWELSEDRTTDADVGTKLKKAVALILEGQNPGGGWRYQPSPNGGEDTSVTSMIATALASARQAGITVPDKPFEGVLRYLNGVQNTDSGGFRYALAGKGVSLTCSAGGVYAAIACGAERKSETVIKAIKYINNQPKRIFTTIGHFYYLHYYAVHAMGQAGVDEYAKWYPRIRDSLIAKQKPDGSWGKGYEPYMAILILGTPYQYIKTVKTSVESHPLGRDVTTAIKILTGDRNDEKRVKEAIEILKTFELPEVSVETLQDIKTGEIFMEITRDYKKAGIAVIYWDKKINRVVITRKSKKD